MLGQVTAVRIGNQKLISADSIALFGVIGILAVIGAVLTDRYVGDENNYLAGFAQGKVALGDVSLNDTTRTIDVFVNCNAPLNSIQCPDPEAPELLFEYDTDLQYMDAITEFNLNNFNMSTIILNPFYVTAYVNSADHTDFRVFYPPQCRKWCSAMWMFRLCVAVAGLCVGFSGLVFLYLYLGCILERLYPRRRLQRLANLLLMQGEEAPKLDRPNTSSKSESIRPDLKEY